MSVTINGNGVISGVTSIPNIPSEDVVFDGGTSQDVLDNAKAMQNYATLRAYTGRATGVRITTPGIDGFFQRRGTTGLTDNGGTIIIDALGRAWERLFTGAVNVKWFGAVGGDGAADDTLAIQKALNSIPNASFGAGEVFFPDGIYRITYSLVLPYEVSIRGVGRASRIQTDGDFAAITWSASSVSLSKNCSIKNIALRGGGKSSGLTNNHGILFNHPYGIEQFSLKNIFISEFGGWGAKCTAPVSDAWIVWQYAHWDTVFITQCNNGLNLGNGFVGESLFLNCAITETANIGIEFTTLAPSITPAQGLTFTSCYFGRGTTQVLFTAQCAGVTQFNNCHFEGASEAIMKIASTTAPYVVLNDCWYIFNVAGNNAVLGINYTSVDTGFVNIRGGKWQIEGAGIGNVAAFIKTNGNAYVQVGGAPKVTGTPTKQIDVAGGFARNTVSGNVSIKNSSEAEFSPFQTFRIAKTLGVGAFPALDGVGFTFPANQSPSTDPNTLDDYEEGTFTPVFTCANPGNLAVSYSTQLGYYQKVGNRVTVYVDIVTSSFTHSTATGGVFINGHPVVSGSTGAGSLSEFQGVTKSGYTQFGVLASGIIRGSGSGQSVASLQISDFPSGGSLILRYTMTYIATS